MHGVVTIALAVALGKLITSLVTKQGRAEEVLASAGAIWGMNVLVFASWYWRIDGGGPKGRRLHKSYKEGAFLFPQATMSEEAKKMMNVGNWHPHFIDYLFVSFNAGTAFSPTDTPVLSRWVKVAMMVQR